MATTKTIKEFKVISQSKNGRRAMLVYVDGKKKDKKSITRHVVRDGKNWTYKIMGKTLNESGEKVDTVLGIEVFSD